VSAAAARRLALERAQSAAIIDKAADRTAAETAERVVIEAWRKWYVRALESVLALPVTPAGDRLQARVRAAIAAIAQAPDR